MAQAYVTEHKVKHTTLSAIRKELGGVVTSAALVGGSAATVLGSIKYGIINGGQTVNQNLSKASAYVAQGLNSGNQTIINLVNGVFNTKITGDGLSNSQIAQEAVHYVYNNFNQEGSASGQTLYSLLQPHGMAAARNAFTLTVSAGWAGAILGTAFGVLVGGLYTYETVKDIRTEKHRIELRQDYK